MHVVIVVTNLPFERDRRVQRQAHSLAAAGHEVTVVAPRPAAPVSPFVATTGITVRRYPAVVEGRGLATWLLEYAWSVICVGVLLIDIARLRSIDAVQVCNPPDIFWPMGLVARRLGCVWVFDHHDLSPEMYDAKGRGSPVVRRALVTMERMSVRHATAVVATNASFRDNDVARGRCPPQRIVVVRNGPRLAELPAAVSDVPRTAPYVVAYVGMMAAQDSVDVVVRAAAHVVHVLGRRDCRFVLLGDGETWPMLRRLAVDLDVVDEVRLPGWVDAQTVSRVLQGAAVGVQPDQPSALNELSTMAKTIEYMAHGVPVVAADLVETRRSAGAAATYVTRPTPGAFAEAICALIDDPQRRREMAKRGRERVSDTLAWEHQAAHYVQLFERLTDGGLGNGVEVATVAQPATPQ